MKTKRRIQATLALGCIAAIAQTSSASAADCPGADTLANEQTTSQIEDSVLCLINDRRTSAGMGTVTNNVKLASAANRHSQDMVSQGFFAHTSPGGDDFIDRISDAGYMKGARSWLVGENLVWGSGDLGTPASMVQAWMDSPPHRANLLRTRFREVGISAVDGTPFEAGDSQGVTVSSEYGYRDAKKKKARKARRSRKAHAQRR